MSNSSTSVSGAAMLAAGAVGGQPAVESSILFPPLLESMAHAQSAGLPLPAGIHPAAVMMQELQPRFTHQTPLGLNPDLDEYFELLIQLQHAQRQELDRIMHVADDFKVTFEAHIRALPQLAPASAPPPAAADLPSPKLAQRPAPAAANVAVIAHSPASSLHHLLAPGAKETQRGSGSEGEEEAAGADDGAVEGFIASAMDNCQKRRRSNLPRGATTLLRRWLTEHREHPYPNDEEKKALCESTGLNLVQVCNWFINNRRRLLPQLASAAPARAVEKRRSEGHRADDGEDNEDEDDDDDDSDAKRRARRHKPRMRR